MTECDFRACRTCRLCAHGSHDRCQQTATCPDDGKTRRCECCGTTPP